MIKILNYFTKNKLIINLMMVFIFVAGIYSLMNIKREAMPSVETDYMTVAVIYPGASSSDVELNAVIPIEEELETISGIDYFKSLSIENSASIFIVVDEDADDKRKVKDEIFRKISKSSIEDIPDEVEDIIVTEMSPKIFPVYTISITGKQNKKVSQKELYKFVDAMEKQLKRLPGVNDITKSGYQDREIHINVMPEKMKQHYVSLNDIVSSIQSRNVRSTGGTIQSLHKEQNLVTIGQFQKPLDVKNVIIRSGFEQRRLQIKDVAAVKDNYKDADVLVHVNSKKAVTMAINKKENADIIQTVEGIKNFFKENKKLYDEQFTITLVEDRTMEIKSLLEVVSSNAIIGFILVLVILFIFLDFKTSFWTALGIPISLFMVFIYMYIQDYTLNIMTLGAFITVLGMMVDHGIVISEVIYENKAKGMSPIEATLEGVKSILSPVTVTVLTTIVAFLPMMAIGGIMGKFVFIFPVVVVATLIASYFEATVILPGHLSHSKPPIKKKKEGDWFTPVVRGYGKFLAKVLKWRYAAVAGFIAVFIASIAISGNAVKNFVLFDDDSADTIYINMEAPRGTSLEGTEKLTMKIEDLVLKHIPANERISMLANIGHHTFGMESLGNHENWSQVRINLVPKTERERNADQIIDGMRKKINTEKIKSFEKILFVKDGSGPPKGEAVNIKIISNNEKSASTVFKNIEAYLKTIKGVRDIDNDQKSGKEELKININYAKLAQYGITVSDVAQTVRTAYEGTEATYIQTLDQKLDYRVQVDQRYHKGKNFLLGLLIPNKEGRLVRLGDIATLKIQEGKTLINHYNGDRTITITANVDEDIITSNQVAALINTKFHDVPKKYSGTYLIHGGEAEKTKETMGGVAAAFMMAFLFIYFILILMFRSLSQPLIILLTIPFGIVGALLAFTAHGMSLSFFGIIGIIGLIGVVINDSVIMVDFINKLFTSEKSDNPEGIIEKIVEGAKQRFRPVALTTLTTVAALLPTVYGIGGDAKMLVPAVLAMAYGLLFATLLTLILIPSLYMVNDDLKGIWSRTAQTLKEKSKEISILKRAVE